MRTLLFLLWLIWLCFLCVKSKFAQGSLLLRIDSVKVLLKSVQEDTNKVILLSELSYLLRSEKADPALAIVYQALQLSNQLNYLKGTALAMHDVAAAYFFKDEYAKTLEWCKQAQNIVKKWENTQRKMDFRHGAQYFRKNLFSQKQLPKIFKISAGDP